MYNRCSVNIVSFESIGHHINTKGWKKRYNLSVIFAQYLISNAKAAASLPDLINSSWHTVFLLLLRWDWSANYEYKQILASKRHTHSWKLNFKIFPWIFKTQSKTGIVFFIKKFHNMQNITNLKLFKLYHLFFKLSLNIGNVRIGNMKTQMIYHMLEKLNISHFPKVSLVLYFSESNNGIIFCWITQAQSPLSLITYIQSLWPLQATHK